MTKGFTSPAQNDEKFFFGSYPQKNSKHTFIIHLLGGWVATAEAWARAEPHCQPCPASSALCCQAAHCLGWPRHWHMATRDKAKFFLLLYFLGPPKFLSVRCPPSLI